MSLLISRPLKVWPCFSQLPPLLSSFSTVAGALPPTRVSTASPLSLSSLFEDQPRTVKRKVQANSSAQPRQIEQVDTRSFPFADKSFGALKLSRYVVHRLREEQVTVPTDVQVAAIPVILDGHDAAVQSYTGSGKTLAYLLPILSRVGPLREGLSSASLSEEQVGTNKGGVEVVVVVPSRELAIQIIREAEKILNPQDKRIIQQLIGGANPNRQEEALKKNKPLIVVGTPGRISELSRAGKLHTHACRFLVLDEADQLLSSKFRDDMRRILEHVGQRRTSQESTHASNSEETGDHSAIGRDGVTSGMVDSTIGVQKVKEKRRVERQTILVSATMPAAVLRAAATWGNKPLLVRATSVIDVVSPGAFFPSPGQFMSKGEAIAAELKGAQGSLPPNLEHFYVTGPVHHRVDNLRKCIHSLNAQSVLVFMNLSRRLKDTEYKLTARGIAAGTLSGELGKMERAAVLAAFRSGKLRVLVVSEVGARGLDIAGCDLVVNLELPTDGSHYAHRAGRTGRLGRKGTVVSICEGSEEFVLEKFEKQLDITIRRANLSEGKFLPAEKSAARQAMAHRTKELQSMKS